MKRINDPVVRICEKMIHAAVQALAVLVSLVVIWGVADVVWELYNRIRAPPIYLLNINDIVATFGAFLAVLVAIEIFINITVYLQEDTIHVKTVLATALIAAARKVIILEDHDGVKLFGLACIIVALGVTYWMVSVKVDNGAKSRLKSIQ